MLAGPMTPDCCAWALPFAATIPVSSRPKTSPTHEQGFPGQHP